MSALSLSSPYTAPYSPFNRLTPTVRFSGLPSALSVSRHDTQHALTHGAVALLAGSTAGTLFGPEIHHAADALAHSVSQAGPVVEYVVRRGTEVLGECLAPITLAMQAVRRFTGKPITKKTLAHDFTVCAVPTLLTHAGVDAVHGFNMTHAACTHVAEHAHTFAEQAKDAVAHTALYCALPGFTTDMAKATRVGKKIIQSGKDKLASAKQAIVRTVLGRNKAEQP